MRARAKDFLVSAALLLVGRRRTPRLGPRERERIVPLREPNPRSELVAIACFGASSICAIAFVAFYALDRLPRHTQLLGGALGLAFCFLAAGLIVSAKQVVVSEQLEHEYPLPEHPEEQETIVQLVEESGDRLSRRTLFKPDEPGPALVCPCHYSTFDPANGGGVEFGPAGRKLPMLPLSVDAKGHLRARGNFDGPVGPSWWGVRLRDPTT